MTLELLELQKKTAGMTFDEIVGHYEGQAGVKWLAKIEREASEGSWQAAAWKLERRYPNDYGRKVVDQRTSGADVNPEKNAASALEPDFDRLSADELEVFVAIWDKLHGKEEKGNP
jgi:hypothetical protein